MSEHEPSVRERRFAVEANYNGWRLDHFLTQKISRLSRSQVRRIITSGGVSIEPTRRIKAGTIIRNGEWVIVRQHLGPEDDLYDDVVVLVRTPRYVAFNKPAGMLIHPTASAYRNTLARYAEERGFGVLHVVHRLDRETSGVVLMARTPTAARGLSHAFAIGSVEKTYRALVVDPSGLHQPGMRGAIDVPLGFDEASALPTLKIHRGLWQAHTFWRCVARHGDRAELLVNIEHGRQHQIRAHLALYGTPIVGDKLYLHGEAYFLQWADGTADPSVLAAPRHALHAERLIVHESTGELVFEAPIPMLFESLMGRRRESPIS